MKIDDVLEVHDIWDKVSPLLLPETRKRMEVICHNTVVQYNENNQRKTCLVRYLGVTVDSVEEGIPLLVGILEDANNKYQIFRSLSKAFAIPLIGDKYIVASYVALKNFGDAQNGFEKILREINDDYKKRLFEDEWYHFNEGDRPTYIGDNLVDFDAHQKKQIQIFKTSWGKANKAIEKLKKQDDLDKVNRFVQEHLQDH